MQPGAIWAAELRGGILSTSTKLDESNARTGSAGQVILWPGGATLMDAQSRLLRFERYADALYPFLKIEPVVVESTKIPGLASASFAVAIGICPQSDTIRVMKVLKTIVPDLYSYSVASLRVDAAPMLTCPSAGVAAKDGKGESVPWEFKGSRRIALGPNWLQALAFRFSRMQGGEIGRDVTGLQFLVLWMDGDGSVINSEVVERKEDTVQFAAWTDRPNLLAWTVQYEDPPCKAAQDRFIVWTQVSAATAEEHDIHIRDEQPVKTREGSCESVAKPN